MTQIVNKLVTDDYRVKAQMKYELNCLEGCLYKYLQLHHQSVFCPEDVKSLCGTLAYKYSDYLKLVDPDNKFDLDHLVDLNKIISWSEQCYLILNLKQQLAKTIILADEIKLITDIASLYYQIKKSIDLSSLPQGMTNSEYKKQQESLLQLFTKENTEAWLEAVVDFGNEFVMQDANLALLFGEWSLQQQQSALDFFSSPRLIHLINAIFFYKLNPDKLFNELLHPEKLVSVSMRLGILHSYIELLQQQLYSTARQRGLKPDIDYLFHGDDLPHGIMIEMDDAFRPCIQFAIKYLKVKSASENEEQITIEILYDLARAYKFWFNPNRLIDAVMVLQQRLIKEKIDAENNLLLFQHAMVELFNQLTTTECLDLYGYFVNNNSRYLLYTLFVIMKQQPLDWLPPLNCTEKKAIENVFHALQCVMEALRIALQGRHITTEPYVYDLEKQELQIGRRNRDAVFRILAIYGRETTMRSDLEKLFSDVEDAG